MQSATSNKSAAPPPLHGHLGRHNEAACCHHYWQHLRPETKLCTSEPGKHYLGMQDSRNSEQLLQGFSCQQITKSVVHPGFAVWPDPILHFSCFLQAYAADWPTVQDKECSLGQACLQGSVQRTAPASNRNLTADRWPFALAMWRAVMRRRVKLSLNAAALNRFHAVEAPQKARGAVVFLTCAALIVLLVDNSALL